MQESLFLIKKSSVERLTCILRIMKDGGRNKDGECDEVLKQFSFFLERSLPEDCDAFSMETGRLDTLYFDRLANRVSFRTSGKLLNCFLFCHTDMPQ